MGAAFAVCLLRPPASTRRPSRALLAPAPAGRRRPARAHGALLGAFAVASAVLARVGPPRWAPTRSLFQLFVFLALMLDAIAIAGQVLVGRASARATPRAPAGPRGG